MGGRGSGGARVGAGRPRRSDLEKALTGSKFRPSKSEQPTALPAVDEFEAPDDLTTAERLMWLELSPHAFQARTLTRASSYAFRLLCRNIVLEREMAKDNEQKGGANHRGIIQRVEAGLLRFKLCPMGKPMIEEAPKVADPFDEFEHVH